MLSFLTFQISDQAKKPISFWNFLFLGLILNPGIRSQLRILPQQHDLWIRIFPGHSCEQFLDSTTLSGQNTAT